MSLLEIRELTKSYPLARSRWPRRRERKVVVDRVSLDLEAGACLAVVGESGAGKSTLGRLALRLIEADRGTVRLDGTDVRGLGPAALRASRRDMQMIFQDPYSAVDPRMTVAQTLLEPLRAHGFVAGESPQQSVHRLLDTVGLTRAYAERYPAELSGGQLQRVSIARALAVQPKLIVCDEPVTALDVSVRAQIINLLLDLKDELGVAYLFICHDLAVVEVLADEVMVMRNGAVVETGGVDQLFTSPRQEYTRELLRAVPRPIPRSARAGSASLSNHPISLP